MRVIIIWLTLLSMLVDNIFSNPLLDNGVAARTFSQTNMKRNTQSAFKEIKIQDQAILEPGQSFYYRIRAFSLKVCQLRIDFKSFDLPQPPQPTVGEYVRCLTTDRLHINELKFDLCGRLIDQHIYVPFDVTKIADQIELKFDISSNQYASWTIEINQIECNHKAPLVTPDKRQAPEGCLQYFHEPVRRVQSFNFGFSYYGNTRYAICFSRHPMLVLSEVNFNMDGIVSQTTGFDADCISSVDAESKDYIAIPFAEVSGVNEPHSLFCLDSLDGKTINIKGTGPLVIYVNTDQHFELNAATPLINEKGFSFIYRVVNSI